MRNISLTKTTLLILIVSLLTACTVREYPSDPPISELVLHPEDYNGKEVNVTGKLGNWFFLLSCEDASMECALKDAYGNEVNLHSSCFDNNTQYLNGEIYTAIGTFEAQGSEPSNKEYSIMCSEGLHLTEI